MNKFLKKQENGFALLLFLFSWNIMYLNIFIGVYYEGFI